MRRLIIEVPLKEFTKAEEQVDAAMLQHYKSFEILSFLRRDKDRYAFICKLQLKNPTLKIIELARVFPWMDIQILDQVSDKGIYTIFAKGKTDSMPKSGFGIVMAGDLYLTKFEMTQETFKMTLLGNVQGLKSFLKNYEKLGVNYIVSSVTDASFSPDNPLGTLTEKQREVITTAFNLGYYDIPRRADSDQVAKKLGLVNSTFVAHRRKAERRLIAELLGKN